ncbi:hypothetical protein Tco_0280993 [Tanacetum coccineum]
MYCLSVSDLDREREADLLLHHEVEGQVDKLVDEVEGLENQHAELVDEQVIKMVKEVTERTFVRLWIAKLVPHLVTPEKKRNERNGSLKKNTKKRGNGEEPGRDGNFRDDNKRSRTGRGFSTTTNPVRKEYTGHFAKDCRAGLRIVNPLNAKNPTATRGAYFEYGGTDHYKAVCPRLNRAPGQGGNRPNQAMAIEGGQVTPNIIDGMDWLSRHKAEIVCHEKIVRISLTHREMLRVLGKWLEDKVRHLMSTKAEKQKLKDIVVVRNFSKFLRHVINGDGVHIDPSKIESVNNWEAPRTPSEVRSFLGLAGRFTANSSWNFSKMPNLLSI